MGEDDERSARVRAVLETLGAFGDARDEEGCGRQQVDATESVWRERARRLLERHLDQVWEWDSVEEDAEVSIETKTGAREAERPVQLRLFSRTTGGVAPRSLFKASDRVEDSNRRAQCATIASQQRAVTQVQWRFTPVRPADVEVDAGGRVIRASVDTWPARWRRGRRWR